MGLARSAAVVVGSFALGESDRVVTFFTRDFGKVRGVAKAARRMKSRFTGGLELFTMGELLFFDGGRSELVQVDHFDVVRPFARVRAELITLGHAAWVAECVGRLTAERDPNPAIYGLLARALGSFEAGVPAGRVAVAFGARFVDALGHRLRLDVCVACRRARIGAGSSVAVDIEGGGVVCPSCARALPGLMTVAPATVRALGQLRRASWSEATSGRLGAAEEELRGLLEAQAARLMGHPARTSKFLREVSR